MSQYAAFVSRAWNDYATVVTFGPWCRAAWWPPDGDLPAMMLAPSVEKAQELLDLLHPCKAPL